MQNIVGYEGHWRMNCKNGFEKSADKFVKATIYQQLLKYIVKYFLLQKYCEWLIAVCHSFGCSSDSSSLNNLGCSHCTSSTFPHIITSLLFFSLFQHSSLKQNVCISKLYDMNNFWKQQRNLWYFSCDFCLCVVFFS